MEPAHFTEITLEVDGTAPVPLWMRAPGECPGMYGLEVAMDNAVHHATGVRVRDLPAMCDALLT